MLISPLRHHRWITAFLIIVVPLALWAYHRASTPTLEARIRQCRELRDHRSWKELARVAQKWSDSDPDRADPWLFRAEAAEAVDDMQAVVNALDHVPVTDRRAVEALVRKGVIEFEILNRPWDGIKTCDRILLLDQRVLAAHQQAIFFCAMTLQRANMVRRIRHAIRVRRDSPESYFYLAGASWLYFATLYENNSHWLESDPDSETFQVARAMQVYKSEAKTNPEFAEEFESIPEPEELLKKYPQNIELLAYFLEIRIADGDLDGVKHLLEAAPQAAANEDARFWRGRAWILDSQGKPDEAIDSLLRAFAIDPYWPQIHYDLAEVSRRSGKREMAERFLKLYQASNGLMDLMKQTKNQGDLKFCAEMLKLAELVDDVEVLTALRARLSLQ